MVILVFFSQVLHSLYSRHLLPSDSLSKYKVLFLTLELFTQVAPLKQRPDILLFYVTTVRINLFYKANGTVSHVFFFLGNFSLTSCYSCLFAECTGALLNRLELGDELSGFILLASSLILLCSCLILVVKLLQSMLQ